jgi:hypothetical protein
MGTIEVTDPPLELQRVLFRFHDYRVKTLLRSQLHRTDVADGLMQPLL